MIGEKNLNYHTNILYFSLKNTKYFYILADKGRKNITYMSNIVSILRF